jgi:two-component system cell cycle sensor histidine kinase/response regulator CckA
MDAVERPVILIVDDEPTVTEMLQDVLETRGYLVLAATTSAQVLAMLAEDPRPIDLLLVDVIMPQMSGWELAALVRQRRPDCRVVFMSAYPADRLPAPGVPAGAPILLKPITIEVLLEAVRTALGVEGSPGAP